MNGANEELVHHFLKGRIGFLDIQNTLETLMDRYQAGRASSVEELLDVDGRARRDVREALGL